MEILLYSDINIKRDFYKMYTPFYSDLIMDHMCISGNEPHQWSFAKQSGFKSRKCWPESAKTSWSQKGWCNKPTKLQFQSKFQLKMFT